MMVLRMALKPYMGDRPWEQLPFNPVYNRAPYRRSGPPNKPKQDVDDMVVPVDVATGGGALRAALMGE